jgi:hypothetical protein
VIEEGTKIPIEGAIVSVIGSNGSEVQTLTDADGKITGMRPPGSYRVTVRRRGRSGNVGTVVVEVTTIELDKETKLEVRVPPTGEVRGRVLDVRGEPVPSARVTLMLRGYRTLDTKTTYQATPFTSETNDLGEYILTHVPGGVAFFVYAEPKFAQAEFAGPAPRVAEATGNAAANVSARLPVLASTFYPSSLEPSGGQSISLTNGEIRERLDIRLVRAPSLCAEGQVVPAPLADAAYTVNLEAADVGVGVFNDIGAFRTGRTVRVGEGGIARICNLWPGSYTFTVQPERPGEQPKGFFGTGQFTVSDKDLTSLTVNGAPVFDWQGEVTVDGVLSDPVPNKLQIRTISTTVTSVGRNTTSEIPGKFTLPNLHIDQYLLVMGGFPDGWYVKNAFFGDFDLKTKVGLSLNQANVPVKVVLSPKGAKVKVKVTDDKGQPVANKLVSLVRRDLKQPQDLVGRMMRCYSNERGECSVFTLTLEPPYTTVAPGEYIVLAADLPYNKTADAYDQIWRVLQSDGTKVKLEASQTTDIAVKPVILR